MRYWREASFRNFCRSLWNDHSSLIPTTNASVGTFRVDGSDPITFTPQKPSGLFSNSNSISHPTWTIDILENHWRAYSIITFIYIYPHWRPQQVLTLLGGKRRLNKVYKTDHLLGWTVRIYGRSTDFTYLHDPHRLFWSSVESPRSITVSYHNAVHFDRYLLHMWSAPMEDSVSIISTEQALTTPVKKRIISSPNLTWQS